MAQLRVGIIQYSPSADAADNREVIRGAIESLDVVDLVVLPEYSAWFHHDASTWASGAEPLDGPFVGFLSTCARERDVTIVAGLLRHDGSGVRNSIVVVDETGVIGLYDKIHLYDAFGARESDAVVAGDSRQPPLVLRINDVSVGVQTCYDIRFPEVSRRLVDSGATVLVVPADWVPGVRKSEQWETLLCARAIENVCWVVAANHSEPSGVGLSMVVSPDGIVQTVADSNEALLRATIDSTVVVEARRTNPALTLRRFTVVPR